MLHVNFDRFAIALSSICAIHCIALPIIAGAIPLLAATIHHGNALHEFWFHQFILIFILPISIFALVTGYRSHRQFTPIVFGITGLTILVITALFAESLIAKQIMPIQGETMHIANIFATKTFRTSCQTE